MHIFLYDTYGKGIVSLHGPRICTKSKISWEKIREEKKKAHLSQMYLHITPRIRLSAATENNKHQETISKMS